MKEHGGYDPKEMPRHETGHEPRGPGPTAATRPIDTSLGVIAAPRASRGDKVAVWIDVIKPDKRDEWERLLHEVLGPAVARLDPDVLRRIRLLEPRAANTDGTWTYLIVPDPYIDGVEYDTRPWVEEAFGTAAADEFERIWDECHAAAQTGIETLESAW